MWAFEKQYLDIRLVDFKISLSGVTNTVAKKWTAKTMECYKVFFTKISRYSIFVEFCPEQWSSGIPGSRDPGMCWVCWKFGKFWRIALVSFSDNLSWQMLLPSRRLQRQWNVANWLLVLFGSWIRSRSKGPLFRTNTHLISSTLQKRKCKNIWELVRNKIQSGGEEEAYLKGHCFQFPSSYSIPT